MLRRTSLGLALVWVLVIATATMVEACTCGGTSDHSALQHADVAFVGVVAAVEDPRPLSWLTYSTADPILYTFSVDEVLKGDASAFVVVRSYRDGASCGVTMAVGERWRIYAHHQDLYTNRTPDELWVWLCDGNERLATNVPTLPVPFHGDPSILLVGAGVVLLGAAIAVVVRRRRTADAVA